MSVRFEVDGQAGTITSNRPDARNALDLETLKQLAKSYWAALRDSEDRHEGRRAFAEKRPPEFKGR